MAPCVCTRAVWQPRNTHARTYTREHALTLSLERCTDYVTVAFTTVRLKFGSTFRFDRIFNKNRREEERGGGIYRWSSVYGHGAHVCLEFVVDSRGEAEVTVERVVVVTNTVAPVSSSVTCSSHSPAKRAHIILLARW